MCEEMSYQIVYDKHRFPKQIKRPDGTWGCRGCGGDIPKSRQAWCSKKCSDQHHPGRVRFFVHQRDKGVCCLCGLDTKKELRMWRAKQDRWNWQKPKGIELDHIIPFVEGGLTILENMRSLCRECHMKRTALWKSRRKIL